MSTIPSSGWVPLNHPIPSNVLLPDILHDDVSPGCERNETQWIALADQNPVHMKTLLPFGFLLQELRDTPTGLRPLVHVSTARTYPKKPGILRGITGSLLQSRNTTCAVSYSLTHSRLHRQPAATERNKKSCRPNSTTTHRQTTELYETERLLNLSSLHV